MDHHFRTAPLERNMPALMGLLDGLVQQFLRRPDPRRHALCRRPRAFSRLSSAIADGEQRQARRPCREAAGRPTGPVIWGEPGTDGQHSFYQLIHQGTKLIPCDLIGFCRPLSPLADQHDLLTANLIAQAEALAFGKTAEELAAEGSHPAQTPFRVCEGTGRPTSIWRSSSRPMRSGGWSRSMSTVSSPRARSGASIPSTSGASNSARRSPSALSRNSRMAPNRRSLTTVRPMR